MPDHDDSAYNRDDQQKPDPQAGQPPRSATEPAGAKGDAKTSKTLTDPSSGETQQQGHAPNQAQADQTDGAARPKHSGI